MTSSNENLFRITGDLCREFTGHHRGQWRGALMFSLICSWTNGWVNTGEARDLRRHIAYYDVTVIDASYLMRVSWRLCIAPVYWWGNHALPERSQLWYLTALQMADIQITVTRFVDLHEFIILTPWWKRVFRCHAKRTLTHWRSPGAIMLTS